jgi:hypothetical protein
MRENVQTDDRILVPITLDIRDKVSQLLLETDSIVTGVYKYNALFFLNPQNENQNVSVLVYNASTESWWYWKLPLQKVLQTRVTEDNIEILGKFGDDYILYDLYADYFDYVRGSLKWELYADRLTADTQSQIKWFWESAILHFSAIDYKKQLLYTNFTFSDQQAMSVSFEYKFKVYDKESSDSDWSDVTQVVDKIETYSSKSVIARFSYLQLYLTNADTDEYALEAYTRPKFSAISFKYRILPGGLI